MKSATNLTSSSIYSVIDFNPRPREEGDFFQFLNVIFFLYFNPRPREEGDKIYIMQV